jgi:urea transport system substrate-binding protein
MKRWVAALVIIIGAVALTWAFPRIIGRVSAPIRVGLLHSKTGSLAASERWMIEAEVQALEEINASGILGRQIEWFIADGRSDADTFAREARRLILEEKVSVIFGCYASFTHRAVRPVVEQLDNLLFFPVSYEGLDESPNIVYTGSAPNQQIIPALKWAYDHLAARKFYLVGTDSIYSHGLHAIVTDLIRSLGAEVLGEEYLLFDSSDVDGVVTRIRNAKPDLVINSLIGQSNIPFCKRLRAAGLSSGECPVISYTLTETDLREFSPADVAGDYITTSYLETIQTQENLDFISKFKAANGKNESTSDTIVTAYNSVKLWAKAVDEAKSDSPEIVRKFLRRQSLIAPEGIISIDGDTQHTWRPTYIAKVRTDGSTETVWASENAIQPIPYPGSRTRSEWNAFVEKLSRGWGGKWLNTSRRP